MQKIFDTDNAEDMALLWSILPGDIIKIFKNDNFQLNEYHTQHTCISTKLLKINWHDKKEITRPIQEATEADIGKLCRFWNYEESYIGILACITKMGSTTYYRMNSPCYEDLDFLHCRRLTKQEIEELI